MPSLNLTTPLTTVNRRYIAAAGVILFHMGALWALQAGLQNRPVELIVPAEIIVEMITPTAQPVTPPAPASKPPKPVAVKQIEKKKASPAKVPVPLPLAIADPTPSPTAPQSILDVPEVVATQQVNVPATPTPQSTPVPAPTPAPPQLVLPSTDADYLQNPKPPYPPLSKRLGEQGQVIVRVLIGTDGTAQKTEIKQSSGYDRLDQAALATVMRWRYVPGKRAGVAESMWFNVPISFVLE